MPWDEGLVNSLVYDAPDPTEGRVLSYVAALREALESGDQAALEAALERNVTMTGEAGTAALARRLRAFADKLAALDAGEVLAGRIAL